MKAALLGPVKKTVFPLASGVSLIHIFSPSQGTSWLTYKETILFVSALAVNDFCVPQSFENSDC